MRDGKSTQNRHSTFPAQDVGLVALSLIKERFELHRSPVWLRGCETCERGRGSLRGR